MAEEVEEVGGDAVEGGVIIEKDHQCCILWSLARTS